MGKQQMEFIPTVQAGEPIHYCEDGTPVSLVGNAEIYICLSPSIEMDFSGAELAKRMNEATVQPMGMPRGGPAVENDFGAVCYSPQALDRRKAVALTQVLHDGTVWCIDRHFFMDEFREFKAEMLEQSVYCSLVSTLRFCRGSLKMPPPADLKFGAKGIRGYRMILPNKLRGDRTQREAVRHSERITRFSGASRLVQPFFSALWLAFGLVRPDEDVEYEC